jgi:hypothetical protein
MPTPVVTLPPVVQEVDVNKVGVVVVIPDGTWAIVSRKNAIKTRNVRKREKLNCGKCFICKYVKKCTNTQNSCRSAKH